LTTNPTATYQNHSNTRLEITVKMLANSTPYEHSSVGLPRVDEEAPEHTNNFTTTTTATDHYLPSSERDDSDSSSSDSDDSDSDSSSSETQQPKQPNLTISTTQQQQHFNNGGKKQPTNNSETPSDDVVVNPYGSFASHGQDFSSPFPSRGPIQFPTQPTRLSGGIVQAPPPPSATNNIRPITSSNPFAPIPSSFSPPSTIPNTQSQLHLPPNPSNTIREFEEGAEYWRPTILSPLVDLHIPDEDVKKKASVSSSKPKTTPGSTAMKTLPSNVPTRNGSSSTSNGASGATQQKSTKSSSTISPPETKSEPIVRPTTSDKTLLMKSMNPKQLEITSDKSDSDQDERKKSKVSSSKTKKKTPPKKKTDSDLDSDYMESDDLSEDDKKKKRKKTTETTKKETKKKESKIKGVTKKKSTSTSKVKEDVPAKEKAPLTKKPSTTDLKKSEILNSPKRSLESTDHELNGVSEEPKTKKNKTVSVEGTLKSSSSESKTTSQTIREKLITDPPRKLSLDDLKQKTEQRKSLAKALKHRADDKLKQKNNKEAISAYIRAGIHFSEAAMYAKELFETGPSDMKPTHLQEVTSLLQQTTTFLKQIADMSLKVAEFPKTALIYLLLLVNTKILFQLRLPNLKKTRNFVSGKLTSGSSSSLGASSSASPAISPMSVSTPSPSHQSSNFVSSSELNRYTQRLCGDLDIVFQLQEVEERSAQYNQQKEYGEDAELMMRVHRADVLFVTMFIEEELTKLDSSS